MPDQQQPFDFDAAKTPGVPSDAPVADAARTGNIAVFSVGYERRTLNDLVAALHGHSVEMVIDVRLNAFSRKPGFAANALRRELAEAEISYRHEPALGNPKDNRDSFRQGSPQARERFMDHLNTHGADALERILAAASSSRVALLCYERDHDTCHRSSVLDAAHRHNPALEVVKL